MVCLATHKPKPAPGVPLSAIRIDLEVVDAARPEKSADWELSLATVCYVGGVLSGLAMAAIIEWL